MSGVIIATVFSNGKSMSSKYHLMYIDVIKEANKIPLAQIILLDGDPSLQKFEISNEDFFEPGREIEIKLRYDDLADRTVFRGFVVRHRVNADRRSSYLTLDLKDIATILTSQRKSAVFKEQKDSEIIKQILNKYKEDSLSLENIETTKVKHPEMLQYYCTDWDFILSRVEANGQWMLVDRGKITIKTPEFNGQIKHKFTMTGEVIVYDFEMEADIRHQYDAVETTGWNIKKQELIPPKKANSFSLAQGNLKPGNLAQKIGANRCQLITPTAIGSEELEAWADAKMIKSRISMLRGHIKVDGDADIQLGNVIEIDGIGDRFNGKTLVTGVRHQVNEDGWQTDVQFGLSANWFSQTNNDIIDTPVAGLVPGINGLHIGIVAKYQDDPDKQFRVPVKIPALNANNTDDLIWARLASPEAGKGRGIFFRPEPGDEVVLGFLNDDPRQPIILGSMFSSKNNLPEGFEVTKNNNQKGILTKKSLKILFDDREEFLEISTPKGICLQDKNGNKLTMNDKGIEIKSKKDLIIDVGSNKVTIKASEVQNS